MLTFPYTALADAPDSGYSVDTEFPDEISEGRTGIEQRAALTVFPVFSTAIRWNKDINAATRINVLWDFYRQTHGRVFPFVYFDFDAARVWTGLYVGVGNGSNLIFNAPMLNGASVSVYVDGVLKTVTTHYTLSAGGGANGRDKITFTAGNAPANGAIVTVSFTGRVAFEARFAQPRLSYAAFTNLLYDTGLEIVSVKGES